MKDAVRCYDKGDRSAAAHYTFAEIPGGIDCDLIIHSGEIHQQTFCRQQKI